MSINTRVQLNSNQVAAMFGVSNMSVFNWRKGTKAMTPLPTAATKSTLSRPKVLFNLSAVLTWAKKHGVVVVTPPEELISKSAPTTANKPGPKVRVQVK